MLVVAGIDVGKDSLEVCVDDGPAKRFDNSTAGIRVLVDWLKEHDVSEAAYEPTGGYERQLVRQLDEAGLIPRMVHPFRMRSLARARGFEAKTDGLDAQVLSLYGHTFPMADTQRSKSGPGAGRIARPVAAPASVGQPASTGTQPAGQRDHERQQGLHQTAHSLAG